MRKINASINIKCSPSKITESFLNENMLKTWWKVERCLIQPHSGGLYTLLWKVTDAGFGYVSSGIITLYQPGIMLTIEKFICLNPHYQVFGPMMLHIEVQQNETDCTLYLTQDGYKDGADWDWYYNATKVEWPKVLNELKIYLENK